MNRDRDKILEEAAEKCFEIAVHNEQMAQDRERRGLIGPAAHRMAHACAAQNCGLAIRAMKGKLPPAEQHQRRKELEEKFPWTAEQRFAVDLHRYGVAVARKIAESIADSPMNDAAEVLLQLVVWNDGGELWFTDDEQKLTGKLGEFLPEACVNRKLMALIFDKVSDLGYGKPVVSYGGEVQEVPLRDDCTYLIDFLEQLAQHWHIADIPIRPTMEAVELAFAKAEVAQKREEAAKKREATIKTIVKGKRPEALAAIAACEDTFTLEYILQPKAVNGIAKIATWRVKAIEARIDELKAGSSREDNHRGHRGRRGCENETERTSVAYLPRALSAEEGRTGTGSVPGRIRDHLAAPCEP